MSKKDDMSIISLLARSTKRIKVLKSLEKEEKEKNFLERASRDMMLMSSFRVIFLNIDFSYLIDIYMILAC